MSSAFDRQEGGSHYRDFEIQPTEFIYKNRIPFIEGNIIKYVARWRLKNGLEDLRKAQHYMDLLLELETEAYNDNRNQLVADDIERLSPDE